MQLAVTVALMVSSFVGSASAAPKQTSCYGFEVDAGQLDEVGAEQLRFDVAGTGNKLDPQFNNDENVWVCDSGVVLTSYYVSSDDEGNTFAVGWGYASLDDGISSWTTKGNK